jgi:CHAT domain-containing protein
LYELLLAPAADAITASTRLLLSPDGPLHTLPFAALVGGTPQAYLVERTPLELVSSATVFAELKKRRRAPGQAMPRLVAFGDPKYPAVPQRDIERIGNLELRSALAHGHDFAPLPSTRGEVQGIARLFSKRAEVYLGDQAREERVKTLDKDVRYLHFATHGLLNEHLPLNSALVLTTPENPAEGEDNGLLQAWEVFDSVRLDADLVTLSACDTALGKEMGGEGLVGLTRAFQYAGARSVLASLWGVADESTAVLMKRFYGYLRKGRSKDEALRAAQRDLLRGRYAHPFYWAAFQLNGDWQ